MVSLNEVGLTFPSRRGAVTALAPVTLRLNRGEFAFVVGPSGCGKTSLLKIVGGLLQPTTGNLQFDLERGPPKVRLVFQEHSLFPWMNLLDNAAFGLAMDGVSRKERHAKALAMLDVMGIASFARHFPHELSGGMQQRAALARAFVTEPDVLLLDEPLRALDEPLRLLLQEELEALWMVRRPTVLFVTHDIDEALVLGDRILVFGGRPGRLLEEIRLDDPRPRVSNSVHPDHGDLRWRIWNLLKDDVRQDARGPK